MKQKINYYYLYDKYFKGVAVVHDRTYEGLEIVEGTPKPTLEVFESLQAEEDRQARMQKIPVAQRLGLMEEKQHQARVKALEDIKPFEEKVKEAEASIRDEIFSIRSQAIEIQESKKTAKALDECWEEINKAQEKINADAQEYLKGTDWYVTRLQETGIQIPEEVVKARAEARERIKRGETVYQYWQELRLKEMPKKEEIKAAIRQGGKELERIKIECQAVIDKYPKPTRPR